MKKILPLFVVGILVLSGLGVAAVRSDTLRDNQSSDEVESVLQNEDLDSLLSSYGLDTEDTMGEFEQLLYNLASKRKWRNPSLAAELMNDIAELSDMLEQIGVTDDMTIAEALPIIENNKEQLQKIGINLFCSIGMMTLVGGYCWPPFRYYTALYGIWGTGFHCGVIIKGLIGLQYIDCNFCKERYSGVFIGMIGSNPPVIDWDPEYEIWYIEGDFTLFSHSDVPFVNSTGGSQQSLCPCNQQGNLQNNNMQSSSQQSLQSTQQSSKEPTFSLQDTDLLEETINDLVARFEDAETQESKIAVLEEIPAVLDKYGLLPEDMTVEEAQELIVSSYLETLSSDSFQSDKQSKVAGDNSLAVSKSVVHSTLPLFQVLGSNRIVKNNIKLNTPQPTPWHHNVVILFGRISNLRYECPYWCFNCVNVIVYVRDDDGRYWYHYTCGEKLRIPEEYIRILTNHFVFVIAFW